VKKTPDKGRVLIATEELVPGEIIFKEQAFIAASWDEDTCISCLVSHPSSICLKAKSSIPVGILDHLPHLESEMEAIDGIEDIDKARILLKCFALYSHNHSSTGKTNIQKLDDLIEELTGANMERYRKTASSLFQTEVKRVIPPELPVEKLAKLIAILNTNCHTLENVEGCALFPSACLCEHSCVANANFSTSADILTLTAIKKIEPGQSITLDYGENALFPTEERQLEMRATYGFDCVCPGCTSLPDLTRPFVCPRDTSHVVYPRGGGLAGNDWQCSTCSYILSSKEVAGCLAQERVLHEDPPTTLEEIYDTATGGQLYLWHHMFFHPLRECGLEAASNNNGVDLNKIWTDIIECMEKIIQGPNSEKMILYDEAAQVYVKLGDIAKAKQLYMKAFETAKLCIGPPEQTKSAEFLRFAQDTPTSVEELMNRMEKEKFELLSTLEKAE